MSEIKNGGLDQYGTERFGRLIFVTITKSVGPKSWSYVYILSWQLYRKLRNDRKRFCLYVWNDPEVLQRFTDETLDNLVHACVCYDIQVSQRSNIKVTGSLHLLLRYRRIYLFTYAVVTREIKLVQNYFSLRRRTRNYLKIISEACFGSRIFPNTFKVAEIILKYFQRLK